MAINELITSQRAPEEGESIELAAKEVLGVSHADLKQTAIEMEYSNHGELFDAYNARNLVVSVESLSFA